MNKKGLSKVLQSFGKMITEMVFIGQEQPEQSSQLE
jgi:hypothetical protein